MQKLTMKHRVPAKAKGRRPNAIVGVVASGNCEALFERVLADHSVEVGISTATTGFDDVWKMVITDFAERWSPGGLRISINDGGSTPDVVMLRLMQGISMMEGR